MDLGLKGKVVVVTGASRGIGRSVAEHFATEGCRVGLCARSPASVQHAARRLEAAGTEVSARALDVTDVTAFADWIEHIHRRWGGIDGFVWNVSAQSQNWDESYRVDIAGCVSCIEAVLPLLRKSTDPAIIAIASRTATLSIPSNMAYAALKAALVHYMGSLGQRLLPDGIRVNCVSPGEVYAEDGIWARIKQSDPERFARALARCAPGRMARPEEVARLVVFLASPAASYISGTNILVDGGGHQYVNF